MIHRLINEDWPLIFPAVALLVAALIAAVIVWCAAGPASTVALVRSRQDPRRADSL